MVFLHRAERRHATLHGNEHASIALRDDHFLHATGVATVRPETAPRLGLRHRIFGRKIMGKYVLGWFLGVPLIVLVAIYFFAR
jgi:hypothetical protein